MPNKDVFQSHGAQLDSPASDAVTVTPSDTDLLTFSTRGLYIGGDGDVSVLMIGGASVIFQSVAAGTILPVRVQRVNATGTTATGIVGLY